MEALFAKLVEVFGKNLPQRYIWLTFLSPYIIEFLCFFNEPTRLYWENSNTIKPIIWIVSTLAFALLVFILIDYFVVHWRRQKHEKTEELLRIQRAEKQKIADNELLAKKRADFLHKILNLPNESKFILLKHYLNDHRNEIVYSNLKNIKSLKAFGLMIVDSRHTRNGWQYITRISQNGINYLSNESTFLVIKNSLPQEYQDRLPIH